MHILGNLWFLWIFGNNVEDSMGHLRFVVFYLLCGLAAAGLQIYSNPASGIPMVGASGAIGGVMGAYVLLYPRVNVHMLFWLGFYVTTFTLPAYTMLGLLAARAADRWAEFNRRGGRGRRVLGARRWFCRRGRRLFSCSGIRNC